MRHGQTGLKYVADPRLDNTRLLDKQGKAQEKKVGEYLKSFAPSAIIASPLDRTMETAEIIKEEAEIPGEIIKNKVLLEEYSAADFEEDEKTAPELLIKLAKQYEGQHIVVVSHQDVIEQALRGLGVTTEEAQFPCLMSQGYRLVFANGTLTECQKVNPAKV